MIRIILVFISFNFEIAFAKDIKVYFYHRQPPFILDSSSEVKGLTADVVQYFNNSSNFKFKISPRPRSRLNKELAPWVSNQCLKRKCDSNWIVMWVIPEWGWGENAHERFLWIDLFSDADYVISNIKNKIEYMGKKSLVGKSYAAVSGHAVPDGILELIKEGKVIKEDGASEIALYKRIAAKRSDFAILQKSTLDYLLNSNGELKKIQNLIYVSKEPYKSFTLKIMLPPHRIDLHDELVRLLSSSKVVEIFSGYKIDFKGAR